MAVTDATFSTFADGGDLQVDDVIVGLRDGLNTRFKFVGAPGLYLPIAGGTMEGDIDMNGFIIRNISTTSYSNNGFSIAFSAPLLSGDSSYFWPVTMPGVNGYVLSCTTAGVMTWVPNTAGSMVSVVGTANEIDVDSTDPQNPVLSLSATINLPGSFTIKSTTVVDKILDEDNMASDSASALATQQSIKYYADHLPEILDANNNEVIKFSGVASAVNEVTLTNATAGNAPSIAATGDDTNITLNLDGKGTGGAAVKGVTTNSNAEANYVGELISSVVSSGSAVSMTNNNPANITSISLTAGDWDVWGNVSCPTNTGSSNYVTCSISSSSATLGDPSVFSQSHGMGSSSNFGQCAPPQRFSLGSTTTIYLVAQVGFTAALTTCGGIYARRRR